MYIQQCCKTINYKLYVDLNSFCMFLEHFRWLLFVYSTVTCNAIPVFYNSFECFQIFVRLYVGRERIQNFRSKRSYALVTKANSIDFRNIKIKSVLTTNHSISHSWVY